MDTPNLAEAQAQHRQRLLEFLDHDQATRQGKANLFGLLFALLYALGLWSGAAVWLMLLAGALHRLWLPAVPAVGWWAAVTLIGLAAAGPVVYRIAKFGIDRAGQRRSATLTSGEELASSPTGWLAVYTDNSWLPVDQFDGHRTPMVYAERFDPAHLTDAALVDGFVRLSPCPRSPVSGTDAATPAAER